MAGYVNKDEALKAVSWDTEAYTAINMLFTVEVVRCKDCKWWKLSEYNTVGIHICQKFSGVRGEHDFCSRGEKESEDE